ncbi:MAG: substrate-binding domain-containing protein [Variibacter sp.]|nr:substrate-binding domain-containing protein [Variibacter sp.]
MPEPLKVVTTIAARAVLQGIEPDLVQATGHGIALIFGPPSRAVEMVRNGEAADVVMTTPEGLDELAAAGKVAPGSGRVVARMLMGMGVRAGAPKPDISTVEAFKQTLLSAKSLIHADPAIGSPSAAHFIKVAERLGITDQLKPKTQLFAGLVATAVAEGRAELAIQQLSEILLVPGVDAVGPFPAELQNIIPLAAAVHTQSAAPQAARTLIDLLLQPRARALIEQAGMLAP